jgi:hypothetical protein
MHVGVVPTASIGWALPPCVYGTHSPHVYVWCHHVWRCMVYMLSLLVQVWYSPSHKGMGTVVLVCMVVVGALVLV